MTVISPEPRYVVCIRNDGYAVSLEVRKLYEALPDEQAAGLGQIRVIDESGEDYLYPTEYFAEIELPREVREAFRHTS